MEEKKVLKKRRKFDNKFKEEALKMLQSGRSVSEVARSLDIGENLLYLWRSESKQELSVDNQHVMNELDQLRRQLKQTETERDILKKVIFILSPKT